MTKLTVLKRKIRTNKAKIGIVGLGYVGLPLAIEFAKVGFNVVGIDIDKHRVQRVNAGKSYITDIKDSDLKSILNKKKFRAVSDFRVVKDLDAIVICVPTPLRKTKEPDISFIIDASKKVSKYLSKGSLIQKYANRPILVYWEPVHSHCERQPINTPDLHLRRLPPRMTGSGVISFPTKSVSTWLKVICYLPGNLPGL